MTARRPETQSQTELFPAPKQQPKKAAAARPAPIEPVVMEVGDTVRASWSEKVYMSNRTDVLVSTAIEMAAVQGDDLRSVMDRLQRAMVSAHRRNIQNARGGK